MNEPLHTLSENYFDEVYREKEDPWNLATSDYERDKYNATLASLPRENYESALEIGCSIGVLTEVLLQKCSTILAVDVADAPVNQAKKRLERFPQATIKKMTVPAEFPEQNFDLIVMSEVGYFFSFVDLDLLTEKIKNHLNDTGQLLLVHWTHFVPDFPLTGDEVHNFFMDKAGDGKYFKHLFHQRTDNYRLDLFEKQ
ncbi:methyltransferase [Mucilaginibacter sp. PAMC 26640]|nr:methyltransferase [Mucilaginibacter sp. PAMC 26640]